VRIHVACENTRRQHSFLLKNIAKTIYIFVRERSLCVKKHSCWEFFSHPSGKIKFTSGQTTRYHVRSPMNSQKSPIHPQKSPIKLLDVMFRCVCMGARTFSGLQCVAVCCSVWQCVASWLFKPQNVMFRCVCTGACACAPFPVR